MGLKINVTYEASAAALQTSNPGLYAQFTNAVQTAVNYFQSVIATPITVNISFGWGTVGGSPVTALGASSTFQYTTNYTSSWRRPAKAPDDVADPGRGAGEPPGNRSDQRRDVFDRHRRGRGAGVRHDRLYDRRRGRPQHQHHLGVDAEQHPGGRGRRDRHARA